MIGNVSNLFMICINQNADWRDGLNQGFGCVAVQKIVYNLEFYSVHKFIRKHAEVSNPFIYIALSVLSCRLI